MTDKSDTTTYRRIWALSWPIMLSNLSLPLVGAVDVAMMGHTAEVALVGGVALGGLIFNFLYLIFGFLRMGTTGFTARAFGARQADEVNHIFLRAMIIAFLGGMIMLIFSPLIIRFSLFWFSASAETQNYAALYLQYRIWGLSAALGNAVLLGWLFGLQAMRLSMAQLLIINGLNIALNFLFVLGFNLSIKGVALASVGAEWAGFIITGYLVMRNRTRLGITFKAIDRAALLAKWQALFSVAGDLSLRTLLLWGVEALLVAKAARLGDIELASVQIILVLFGFIAFGLDGFAHATEALVGAAIGEVNLDKLRHVIFRASLLAAVTALVICLGLYVFRLFIILALTSQPVLILAVQDLWHWCILIPLASFLAFQMDGVFVGAASSASMRNGMICAFSLFWVIISYFESAGLDALLASFLIYLLFRGVYLLARLSVIWRLCKTPL